MHGDGAQTKTHTFDFSNPRLYNAKYVPLFKNTSEFLHLFGSAGSGKSRFAAQKEVVKSFRSDRRNRKTLCVRKVFNTIKNSMFAELKTVINEWGLADCFQMGTSPMQIVNIVTGVTFLFIGLDDVEKVKSISGVDRIWIEEATELDEKSDLDQLRLRLRGFDEVQITLSYNPIDEHHWLNTDLHQMRPLGHCFFHSTYKDNEQMLAKDPNYAAFIESTKDSNPNYYRVYGLGEWGKVVEGLVYREFSIIDEFPKDENGEDDIQFYGLDFGHTDPTALIAQHVADASPKRRLVNKEVLYESNLDAIKLIDKFDELKVRKDRKIIADSARPEMIESLCNAGYNVVPCEKGAGSVLSGINRIRKYTLEIVAGSRNLIREVQNYQKNKVQGHWVEEPAPRQVDHGLDAIRYGEQFTSDGGSGAVEDDDWV